MSSSSDDVFQMPPRIEPGSLEEQHVKHRYRFMGLKYNAEEHYRRQRYASFNAWHMRKMEEWARRGKDEAEVPIDDETP